MALGVASRSKLATCHPKLVLLLLEVDRRLTLSKRFDWTIVCGHRGQAEQDAAYFARPRRSSKRWPDSKHNKFPSLAVDIAPYPTYWDDEAAFARLAGYVQAVADEMGIGIRWGGDWDADGRTEDENLIDLPHLELTDEELAKAA
jgi:peptidoglycan L-alanyl-D-glutamate endopeptidase CwlK